MGLAALTDRRTSLHRASGVPALCVLSQVSSPCRSFSLVHSFSLVGPQISCFCAAACQVLAVVPALLCLPALGLCFAGVVVQPLFFSSRLRACCLLLLAAHRGLQPLSVPPPPTAPPPPCWFGSFGCLCCAARYRVLALRFALAMLPFPVTSWVCLLAAPPSPSWSLSPRYRRPAALFSFCALCLFVAALLLVCRRSSLLAVAPPPLIPWFVFHRCHCSAPSCPLCLLCLLAAARPFAVWFRLVLLCPPGSCLLLSRGCHRPCCLVPCGAACCFVRSVVRCTAPCCAVSFCSSCGVWCCLVQFLAAVCCVVSFSAVWCRGVWRGAMCVAVPCCCVFCCAFGRAFLLRCAVLFALCLADPSWSAFLCAVLFLLVLCCAALRLVGLCGAVLLGAVLSAWCLAAFSCAVWCCFVPCRALECYVLCCVLCCAAVCHAVCRAKEESSPFRLCMIKCTKTSLTSRSIAFFLR